MSIEKYLQRSGQRVGIVATNQASYIETLFACINAGEVAVPLRSATDRERIEAAQVNRIITPTGGGSWITKSFTATDAAAIALIAFTSGTEGAPKGVLLSHQNLAEVVARLNRLMQVDSGIREYVGVPVYHSFGFGRCRAVAAAGGQVFIPSNGFNPFEISEMLKRGEMNAISAVPSLWRLLLANQDLIGGSGKRVAWIEIGSQYMSRQEKEALKALFPNARIVQHYGLTEASRTTLLEVHAVEGNPLESVGQALAGVSIKLTPEGQIAIRGNHVAQGYLIDGQFRSLQDESGWFVTKDLGSLEQGYLYYRGRADDVINCGGIKVPPEAVEAKIYASLGQSRGLAVCRKSDSMRGEGFLVAVTKEWAIEKQQLQETVLQAIQEFGINAANAIAIIDVESLPQTATGKIQRRKLMELYGAQSNEATPVVTSKLDAATPIQAAFCRTLNRRQVQPEDTFVSLGGDSLSYVEFSMALERHLGYLPQGWENLRVRDLEKFTPQRQRYAAIESSVVFRAVAISEVVLAHSGLLPQALGGGGVTLLFLITGINFARFQGEALLRGNLIQPIFSLLKNLIIPYLLITLLYQIYRQEFNLSVLLLVSNFIGPEIGSIFPIWFIQVLAQTILLFSLPFGLRSLRQYAAASPWRYGVIVLGIGVGLALLMPFVWNTQHLFNRVPHMTLWNLVLGWCIHFAQSRTKKRTTTVLFLLTLLVLSGTNTLADNLCLLGGLFILWLPYLSVPKLIKPPIQTISSAAYCIYLTHMIFITVVIKVFAQPSPWLLAAAGFLGSLLTWVAVQKLQPSLVRACFKSQN
jgi:acyl-CoA synthetase (AMP-forming)/AMP-acid ligase II